MKQESNIQYHLKELEIAMDAASPFHIMPDLLKEDKSVLDIGCGIGQTLVASRKAEGITAYGIDIDRVSLIYGKIHFSNINFINGLAEYLPFGSNSFDCVISRVALPYTNITKSLTEIHRVLKNGGHVWFTLHTITNTLNAIKKSIIGFNAKGVVFGSYVIINGYLFHYLGTVIPFPLTNRIESFQTERSMQRALAETGFSDPIIKIDKHFVITAKKQVSS
jgi:ubiquinone/menaquinone biosynthesis C-methylase UbiE